MFAAGHLADRISPRTVLAGGLFVSGIAIGRMSAISAPWHAMVLYGVVFALGNGAASLVPIGVIVTRMLPDRVGFANAVIMSGMSVGQLVVIATMTAVLTSIELAIRAICCSGRRIWCCCPSCLRRSPESCRSRRGAARPAKGLALREAARSRQFWLLMGIYGICGFDDFFVATHVVAFAQDRGLDIFLAGNLLALMGLTGLAGSRGRRRFERSLRAGVADRAQLRRACRGVWIGAGWISPGSRSRSSRWCSVLLFW